jgi:hypothetical protein
VPESKAGIAQLGRPFAVVQTHRLPDLPATPLNLAYWPVRALDAVTDRLPPEEDERAWGLFRGLDHLRADVEHRVFTELGLSER